jgi:DNA-3-methyladenine glycosylase II
MQPTPAQLRALRRRDPVLAAAMRGLEPFPGFPDASYRRTPHYEALARAIVFQQLAGAAARTIWNRVVALTPGPRLAPAAELLRLPEERLRGAGLSRNKLASLRDLAEHVEDGRLPLRSIGRRPDEEVVATLTDVRGIGPWTAQMFLMFKLGRLDVLPTADLGVQEGLRRLDGLAERPSPKQLEARGAAWAPLRSVASWYLWRLADGEDWG